MTYSFDVSIAFAMLFGWLIEEGTMVNKKNKEIAFLQLHIYLLFLDFTVTKCDSDDFEAFQG